MTDNPVVQAFCLELFDEVARAGFNRSTLAEALAALREREGTIRDRGGHSRTAIYELFSGRRQTVPDLDLVHDILKVLLQQSEADESSRRAVLGRWRAKHATALRLETKRHGAGSTGRPQPHDESAAAPSGTARTSPRPAAVPAEASGREAAAKASGAATPAGSLLIDDVLVDRRADRVVLDVRLRNSGPGPVNVTRATVRVLDRKKFLAAYHPTADYELLIEDDVNQTPVAHYLKPDDVDRFTLTLGFSPAQQGILFTAEVVLHFNGGSTAVSGPVIFDSCFG
ncbi:hypothetical protein ACIBF1_33920 [Spirillospora sp. NPDC050679]